jgi:signal peptidase I
VRRGLVRTISVVVLLALIFVVLDLVGLLVPVAPNGGSSMAPAIPSCNGRALSEGFTYLIRDPRRGEIVVIHAARDRTGNVFPDPDARDVILTRRIAGIPGDQVVGRGGSVFVNGLKFDDIQTAPFAPVDLGANEYFVLDDNRSAFQDSRKFGRLHRDAIFGRVFLVFWPLSDFGPTEARHSGAAPGRVRCSS